MNPPIVVALERGGLPESEHEVAATVWREGRITARAGRVDVRAFLRSSAKPIQALAVFATDAVRRFEMTRAELALACGSHGGEPFHTATSRGLLERIGLDESALLCGAHPPAFAPAARALAAAGEEPSQLHNNCSGKHAAMLAACVAAAWPTEGYVDPEHPLQLLNRRHVALFCDRDPAQLRSAVDGCSVPTFHVTPNEAAMAFARWTTPPAAWNRTLRNGCEALMDALEAHPEMIGGTERVDTDVIATTGGRVLCKVGAEGMWCAGVRDADLAVAVQCRDGASRASYAAGLAILRHLGALDEAAWADLDRHTSPVIRNHRRLDVGRVHVRFPAGFLP